ncbi:hypothetical protein HQ496_08355 [bacterium]|nr:hypothetical protein [bacterium]
MIVEHRGPDRLRLGIVLAQGISPVAASPTLDQGIATRLAELQGGLTEPEDAYRTEIRDVFRNGSYKPTGRAKPASEYLLRAAAENQFPRINTVVDCCNYLSMLSLLPISIWDVEKAASDSFVFRLGREDESYIFNTAGQSISLKDLIVGCARFPDGADRPIINGVKDSMGTKTSDESLVVAAAIYAPLHDGPTLTLDKVCSMFVDILSETASGAKAVFTILPPGAIVQF